MPAVAVSRGIDARPERVWRIVTDIRDVPRVLRTVEEVERLDDGEDFDVGTRWRTTRRVRGRRVTAESEVVAVQPGRAFTLRATGAGTEYHATVTIVGAPSSTSTVTLAVEARPRTVVTRVAALVAGGLLRRAQRRMLETDLEDLQLAASTTS